MRRANNTNIQASIIDGHKEKKQGGARNKPENEHKIDKNLTKIRNNNNTV